MSKHPSSIRSPSLNPTLDSSQNVHLVSQLYELGLLADSPKSPQTPQTPQPPRRQRHSHSSRDASGGARKKASISSLSTIISRNPFRRSPSIQELRRGSDLPRFDTPDYPPPPRAGSRTAVRMLDTERSRTRRERTFVGSECAVCEEPLEHTLRGERILQFSCAHVSHEACFYEYIKEFDSQYCPTCNAPLGLDTSRGGNVLDIGKERKTSIEKLSSIVRSVSVSEHRAPAPTSTPWDNQTLRERPQSRESSQQQHQQRDRRESSLGSSNRDRRDSRDRTDRDSRDRIDRYAAPSRTHQRNDSEATGTVTHSSGGYAETAQSVPLRRHDYDVQGMEANLVSPRTSITRNPIPPPVVSVRSEFPTLTRSRQQQTLTCLITVEVADSNWKPDPEDLRSGPSVPALRNEDTFARPPSPAQSAPQFFPYEPPEILEEITESLRVRVENWHGLDFSRFGKLRLYGTIRVGKDKSSWQELECYLFAEMLICVKEKKVPIQQWDDSGAPRRPTRCTLKGSILIRKHLNEVTETGCGTAPTGQTEKITQSNLRPADEHVLTLSLSVAELPSFHLRFENRNQLKLWQQALLDLNAGENSPIRSPDYGSEGADMDEEDWNRSSGPQRNNSVTSSSWGAGRGSTAPTEYNATRNSRLPASVHVPIDIVVVIPVSSSMQGVKMTLVRDALKFMVQNLGERDRMGLVTFGSSGGGVPLVGMTNKTWGGWSNVMSSIRPVGQKSHRADVVEGANVAMDLLMQRKSSNPIATILLISDSSTSDADSVDFVVSRAEAAKIAIHSFGLGMTHKPDTMIELSTRTKASYTYVKDWMMLRECLAGCLGALQTMSHQNVKLKLRLPEGSPAKFVKISGALQITKRATGRDAEASLGDLRFGDKRDILVQLVIAPDTGSPEVLPQDPWDSIVSGLEAYGGPMDSEEPRPTSIEELPLIQADLTWGDILREGTITNMPRPSLLAITMLPLPSSKKTASTWSNTPPIPPHPSVVQRRMELLTSDMLTRALTLVGRGQHDRAQHLLNETRSILKGLGKGGLPPVPPPTSKLPSLPGQANNDGNSPTSTTPEPRRTPSPSSAHTSVPPPSSRIPRAPSNDTLSITTGNGIDTATVSALDAELEASLEWINHPAVFGRDSRKAVLQAIGIIASQRGYTFRTPVESLWAGRVAGIKKMTAKSRDWREESSEGIREES